MRAPEPRPRRAALLVVAAIVLAGCGTGSDLQTSGTDTQGADTGVAGGKAVSIVMKSLDFSPLAVKARVGQTVTWQNEDEAPHNVTYVSGPRFQSSKSHMRIGNRFSITLTQAGTIHYICTLHPWMRATITVSR